MSEWSSDVCASDLRIDAAWPTAAEGGKTIPYSARVPVSSREIAGFSAINLPIASPIGMLLEEKRKSHRRKGKRMPTNMPPSADSAARDSHQTLDQIERASCRE